MNKSISHVMAIFIPVILLITACAPTTPAASPLTGALSELSGTVNAKQAEEADFHAVSAGEVIQVNGQVQTGEDGRVRVDLSSGTIIRVAPSSLFTLASNDPVEGGLATKLKLELGRLYIILSGGSLDVDTPSGVASVRGSYMMVEVDPVTQNVIVTCYEGNCSAGGIDFTDGQKVTLFYFDPATGEYRPPLLEDMNDEDFQKWLDDNPEAKLILDQVRVPTPTLVTIVPSPTLVRTSSNEPTCFTLLNPPNSAILTAIGPVEFSWNPQPDTVKYLIVFTSPSGAQTTFETNGTSLTRYIESLQKGGLYLWEVTAFDANNEPICTASSFSFSKLESPTAVPAPKEKEKFEEYCTYDSAQWYDPNAPCYCDFQSYNNPPYCYGGGY